MQGINDTLLSASHSFSDSSNRLCRYKIRASGVKQAEPRLQPKRHRRQSRKTVRQSLDEKLWEKMEEQAEVEDVVRES